MSEDERADETPQHATLFLGSAEPDDAFLYNARFTAPGHAARHWTVTELTDEGVFGRANRELDALGVPGLTPHDWKLVGFQTYRVAVPSSLHPADPTLQAAEQPAVPERLPGYLRPYVENVKRFVDARAAGQPSTQALAVVSASTVMLAQHLGIHYDDVHRYVRDNADALLAACDPQ